MSAEDKPNSPTGEGLSESGGNQDEIPAPADPVIGQIVQKIKNEPFLFVIAIVLLLIGLAVQATGLASQDLRFVITVIAVLAFAVILGYYIMEGYKMVSRARRQSSKAAPEPTPAEPSPEPSITGTVRAEEISKDAQLGGVKAPKEALKHPGSISGDVEVGKARGGRAYGVEIEDAGDPNDSPPEPSD